MTGSKRLMAALCGALVTCACALVVGGASGQSLQQKLNTTQNKLSHTRARAGVIGVPERGATGLHNGEPRNARTGVGWRREAVRGEAED